MKKLIALLLVLVMVMAMFVGCAKKNENTPTTTTKTEEPPQTTTKGDDPVQTTTTEAAEIDTTWIIDEELRDYAGKIVVKSAFKLSQGMQELVDEFNTYYPNIEVEWINYSNNSNGNMQVNTELAAGEIDVLVSFGLNYTSARWKDGLFLDITDKLEDEGIDLVEQWGTDGYNLNDHYYSLPCGGLQYYVVINMTAWEEANLGDIPTEWTWDEYLAASAAMTKKDESGNTVVYGGSSYSSVNTIMYCYSQVTGGDLYMNEDIEGSNYSDPLVLNALERELKAELVDKIWYPVAKYRADGTKDYDAFLKGTIASSVTCNTLRYIHDADYDETRTWITAFAPFPTENAGETNYQAGVHHYSHVGIAANTDDETASWLFAKFYSTYGVKYLCKAGHQTHWKGSDTSEYLDIIYGSVENAAKYIDVESFLHVIGRTDLPNWEECLDELNIATYSDVVSCLNEPILAALNGTITAEECLKQAADNADAYIKAAMGG